MPVKKKFNYKPGVIREIDLEAPELHGKNEEGLLQLEKGRITTDSNHHLNHRIKK